MSVVGRQALPSSYTSLCGYKTLLFDFTCLLQFISLLFHFLVTFVFFLSYGLSYHYSLFLFRLELTVVTVSEAAGFALIWPNSSVFLTSPRSSSGDVTKFERVSDR